MSRNKFKKEEWEPDPDKLCEHSFIDRSLGEKAEIVGCENLANYRVLVFLETETLCEGGIASNPDDWDKEVKIEYWCSGHFKEMYYSSMRETPKMSFRKIERP